MGALYMERHDAASSRARDTKWRPSGRRPEETCNILNQLENPTPYVFGVMPSSDKRTAYYTHIPVDGRYPLVCSRLEQSTRHQLLEGEHHAIFAPYSDRCASVFHCLDCILDLFL